MYFLVALVSTIISLILFILFRKNKRLHLDILTIIYGAATLMWLVDCIVSSIKGEGFLSFEIPTDIYISVWTFLGGLLLWGIITFFINKKNQKSVN